MYEESLKSKRAVYFWEDHVYSKLKESTVGRKGLSLFELKDMDIPIPDFFVISSFLFDKFVSQTLFRDANELIVKGKNPDESDVYKALYKTNFEQSDVEEIMSAYARISGFTDTWVSVRSSVVFPSNPEVSFSGVFSTELNVRGAKNILDSIKRIYASLFTDDVVAYASSKGINLADVKLAVVVQKMVQAEVSGVAFTLDPITQDPTKLSIEAVYGLGDSISLGELTPDTYLLNKKDLEVLEKKISPQEWMKIRVLKSGSTQKDGTEKVTISGAWSHRQKVEDRYLKEIAKISLIVENKLRKAQNIEWVMSGGKVWILQSKDLYERYVPDQIKVESAKSFDTLGEVLKWGLEKYQGIGILQDKAVLNAQKIVQGNRHEYTPFTEKICEYVDLAEGNQVVLAIGCSRVSQFRELTKGKQFENSELEDSANGLAHYLDNKELLNRVIKIVRRVRNINKRRNVDVGIYSPMNASAMTEFKKSLLAGGLRRTSSFRIYAILDNPTDVILADEILDVKIDGVILDMPRIVKVMQGLKYDDTKTKYDLATNSSLKVVDAVCDISKSPSKEVIVIAQDSKDLVKYCVQKGVYGVSVLPSSVKDIRNTVSQEEAKIILKKK